MSDYLKDVYAARAKALTSIKGQLKRRGKIIKTVPRKNMRYLASDFYMDNELCKFKCTRNEQVNIIFEMMNAGRKGWFDRTKAKYFIYNILDTTYVIDIIAVKKYIDNPMIKSPEKTSKGALGEGESWSYMIPISELLKYNLVIETIHKGNKND